MAVSIDDFLDEYNKFSGMSEGLIESNLTLADLQFPVEIWKNDIVRNLAIKLLTAHNLQIEMDSAFDSSDRVFAQRGEAEKENPNLYRHNYYNLTRYGLQLSDLINSQQLGVIAL